MKTLADHADAWSMDTKHYIPLRGTHEWNEMYIEFINQAFAGFGDLP